MIAAPASAIRQPRSARGLLSCQGAAPILPSIFPTADVSRSVTSTTETGSAFSEAAAMFTGEPKCSRPPARCQKVAATFSVRDPLISPSLLDHGRPSDDPTDHRPFHGLTAVVRPSLRRV